MEARGKRLQVMQLIEDVIQSTAASVCWHPARQRKVKVDLDRQMENNQHSWLRAILTLSSKKFSLRSVKING